MALDVDYMADFSRLTVPPQLASKVRVFDADTPITSLLPALDRMPAVIVNKSGSYYGIVDIKGVYRHNRNMRFSKSRKAEAFAVRATPITERTPINEIAMRFHKTRLKALPYRKDGRTIGAVSRFSFFKILLSYGALSNLNVANIMTTPIIAIDAKASISQAKAAMNAKRVNRLVVLRGASLAGIITNHDIVSKYTPISIRGPDIRRSSGSKSNVSIESCMVTTPITIEHSDSVQNAMRQMIENNVSSLIVLNSSRTVGIVSTFDILERFISSEAAHAEPRIILTGIDPSTYEYADTAAEEIRAFAGKLSMLKGAAPLYVAVSIKHLKMHTYEMRARMGTRHRTFVAAASGYMFERTLAELLAKLRSEAMRQHSKSISIVKGAYHDDEEL